ncbi:glycosyltransferase family 2 protein [Sphingomonas profundi]|uniref:glycosyltransferase family 2 protein n=1 Tax=Alterirhizorhabdus profundi TaxID=2681549 RepID=UPI0012E7DFF3|nr:glycosyltransferase family A protein [Sphingomonas profundi]
MSDRPRAAVIMPARNAAGTIVAALASARRQTVADVEIVVVDDGSTDMTAALVAAAAAADPRIRLIRQPHAGPIAARNRAIAASTADHVAPLDADDVWHPLYLAETIAALQRQPTAGFAYALHHVIDAAGHVIATPPLPLVAGHGYHRHLLTNFVGCGSAAVFRRAALLAAGGYDAVTWGWRGAEDYLLQLRVAARAPIACVPRRLVGYRRVPDSLSADMPRMGAARRRAIATALHAMPSPLPVLRWAGADADRAAAARLLLGGHWPAALALGTRALACDPAATLADLARRLRNRWHRAMPAARVPFDQMVPEDECAPRFGPPFDGRLRRLATLDLQT